MKHLKTLIFVALVSAACAVPQSQSSTPTSTSASPTPTESACALSPLTNECFIESNPVVLVKIDDVIEARPQIGLNSTDVIVVEPVEAGLTRLMAVFNSNFPTTVGPVRSARITDIDIAQAFGQPGFVYSGSTSKLVSYLTDSSMQLIGAPQGGTGYFRAEDRYAPHNYIAELSALIGRLESAAAAILQVGQSWLFQENTQLGKTPDKVSVTWASSKKEFIWNSANSYYEIWADGAQTMTVNEAGELEPATATTVFIQQTNLLDSPFVFSSGTVTPYAETFGSGKGWVLTNGHSYYGTWERPSLTDLPKWYAKDGTEIGIQSGRVWWLIAPYADSEVALEFPAPSVSATASKVASAEN